MIVAIDFFVYFSIITTGKLGTIQSDSPFWHVDGVYCFSNCIFINASGSERLKYIWLPIYRLDSLKIRKQGLIHKSCSPYPIIDGGCHAMDRMLRDFIHCFPRAG